MKDELLKRAQQETELYIDMVSNYMLTFLQGVAILDITDDKLDAILNRGFKAAIKVADGITRFGVDVFNERMAFWTRDPEQPCTQLKEASSQEKNDSPTVGN